MLYYDSAKQDNTVSRAGHLHLLINFVEHCWVVVFFRVVVEADHAILLVNASIDLTIFNLHRSTRRSMMEIKQKIYFMYVYIYFFLDQLTMCKTYFSASWGPDSCTRLAMSCKDSVRKVCGRRIKQKLIRKEVRLKDLLKL